MKKSLFQKVICFILSAAMLLSAVALTVSAGELKPDSTAATLDEMQSLIGTTSYAEYIAPHKEAGTKPGPAIILLDNSTVQGVEKVSDSQVCIDAQQINQQNWVDFKSNPNYANALYLPATGSATWSFTVPEEAKGMYYIRIVYYNCLTSESSISVIERKLFIDDRLPFSESGNLSIAKHWVTDNVVKNETTDTTEKDNYSVVHETRDDGYYKVVTAIKDGKKTVTEYKISQDINGNSMAPDVVEKPTWSTYYCQDSTGYEHDYFRFYILNGTHTLTLEAEREPMIVSSIELVPVDDDTAVVPTYSQVLAEYANKGYTAPDKGEITVLEAEFPDFVSDSSVYATNDNSSAGNYPIKSKAQVYNVIGENSYSTVGQWAAYKFTVNKTGLYKFSMRYKQNGRQGMYICRSIKLSGGDYGLPDGTPTVPFAEAHNAQFNYDKEWQSTYITDGSGDPFQFYFEQGVEYTLYLECSLGTLKELIQRVENSLNKINECYLRVLQLTGNDPDKYRDYRFLDIMPEVLYEFLVQAKELEAVKLEFEELCGTTGSHTTTLHTIAILLDTMGSDDGDYVAANMSTLKSYLGTLGTWINNSKAASLVVDSISVCPADASDKAALRKAKAGFFKSIGFEISSFFWSFFTDYDQMGLTSVPNENSRRVEVWLASGRDQSQIWRTMIDAENSFTESTGVAVTLKLVTGGTLLPSILSGKGPDVYMGLGSSDVINYAIRDAVLGVSGNDPRKEVQNEVFSSNYYTYKKDGTYFVVNDPAKVEGELTHVSQTFKEVTDNNFVPAAMDTLRLLDVTYGIPQTMSFAMMFYRMDIFAELGLEVPESWDQLLAILPVLQTNNMSIGVNYISAIDFMIYQKGGNMWRYTDDPMHAGAEIGLDTNVALEAFDYVCRLYSDYSFPVSYDAANRFRTGEMPIVIGDYAGIYNQLIVYATEIAGLWEFTSLPGTHREDGTFNYDSLAGIGATVMLHGCKDVLGAWQYMQWQTSAEVQANYGNKMVALIGPSAKYESANIHALQNLSWTASEKAAIEDQMSHLSSIVNYPGSYIINRYTKFAFLAAVNDGADAVDALTGYIDAINSELERKRMEYGLPIGAPGSPQP
ncbi:MAG: extracellular solute-binding protein [Ruminococcaceae bacterium]|nr:extracellular solute-binding protein [Oscillospiraceae bacterium]